MVCDAIHAEVQRGLQSALARAGKGRDALSEMIREYFLVCHRMSDHILLIYQETQALPTQWRENVLESELGISGVLSRYWHKMATSGNMPHLDEHSIELIAHNITVLGHMWAFRRWFLARHYSIEDYIKLQTDFILGISTRSSEDIHSNL